MKRRETLAIISALLWALAMGVVAKEAGYIEAVLALQFGNPLEVGHAVDR